MCFNIVYHSYRAWHLVWKLPRTPTLWCPRWEWQFSVSGSFWLLHVLDYDNLVAGKRQSFSITFKKEGIKNRLQSVIIKKKLISTNRLCTTFLIVFGNVAKSVWNHQSGESTIFFFSPWDTNFSLLLMKPHRDIYRKDRYSIPEQLQSL